MENAHATIVVALSPLLGAILKDQAGLDETICISVPFNIVYCKEFVEKIESCESNSLKSLGDASTFFETFPEIANCEVNLLKKETDVSFKDHYETVENINMSLHEVTVEEKEPKVKKKENQSNKREADWSISL